MRVAGFSAGDSAVHMISRGINPDVQYRVITSVSQYGEYNGDRDLYTSMELTHPSADLYILSFYIYNFPLSTQSHPDLVYIKHIQAVNWRNIHLPCDILVFYNGGDD